MYTRDTWRHRLDICRATEREMVLDADHDGWMMALVMQEVAEKLTRILECSCVVFKLTGRVGGSWRLGPPREPFATIRKDVLISAD